jgi:ABC-type oligopeptide transport system substrate-binding subunit
MAIDREKICKYILRGGETPATRLIPPTALLK